MLSKLITKKVDWRILNFLISEEASLSEIARKTKTTKANTFHTLKRLENIDLVRKTIHGKTHVYRFNFIHSLAKKIINIIEEEERSRYNSKLNNLPSLLHSFLSASLKKDYLGSIFFGSSLEGKYRDIDIFIILKDKKSAKAIERKIKLIDKKLAPIFGREKELKIGIENKDMLYKNILNGITFGYNAKALKYNDYFLRKKDIKERYIIGYGDILSCLEFTEKNYVKIHLERGIMELIYSILNYFDFFPKNDKEALILFKLKERKPQTVKEAIRLVEKYAWIL